MLIPAVVKHNERTRGDRFDANALQSDRLTSGGISRYFKFHRSVYFRARDMTPAVPACFLLERETFPCACKARQWLRCAEADQ
ncbi:hypothetical protein THTE_2619 [Thermogutta terrifontis]|uniref:Uncharacterized protein n=1 Tax=Thermogutta terrifontis TaxID=1331910 RepID=A0A286RGY5_9BACT|nr:hypothetical protein THTE_2619 [Thermogutta terrifontis]